MLLEFARIVRAGSVYLWRLRPFGGKAFLILLTGATGEQAQRAVEQQRVPLRA